MVEHIAELQKAARQQRALADLGRTVGSSLKMDEVYRHLVEEVPKVVHADSIGVATPNSDGNTLYDEFVWDRRKPAVGSGETRRTEGSLFGEVLRTGGSVYLEDIAADGVLTRYPGLAGAMRSGLRSLVVVPLMARREVFGSLALASRTLDAYSHDDVRLAEGIGAAVAGAVANAKLHSEVEARAKEEELLAEVGRIVSSSPSLDKVYERLAEVIRNLVHFDRFVLTTADAENGTVGRGYVAGTAVPGRTTGVNVELSGGPGEAAVAQSTIVFEPEDREKVRERFPGLLPNFEAGLRNFLVVPVILEGRAVACLHLQSKTSGAYDDRDVQLAERIALQIAGAVSGGQLHGQLQQEAMERATLAEIGRIITSSLSIDAVYERCEERISKLIPSDRVAINLVDADRNTWTSPYVSGMDIPDQDLQPSMPLEGTFTAAAMKNGLIVRLDEAPDLETRYPGLAAGLRAGLKSFLGVPLRSRDEGIGALILDSVDPNAYDEGSLDLAQRVADQMSGAIANAELHATVRQAAHESEVLAKVSRAVSSSTDLNDILDLYAGAVGEIIPVDSAGIGRIDHESQTVTPRHVTVNSGMDLPTRDGRVALPLDGTLSGEVVKRGAAVVVRAETESQLSEKTSRLLRGYRSGIRSFLAAPIMAADQVTTVIHFSATDPDAYGPNEVAFAEKVATQISGAVAIARLYAELETKESQLQGSEERNRAIVQAIPDLIFRVRGDGTFLDFQGKKDEFSLPPEVWLGKPLAAVMPPDVAALSMRSIKRAILTGQVQEFEYTLPVPMPDGEVRDWEGRAAKAGDDEVLILARDITEHKRLSAELLQAQKMEAVGTLAGGIAHDFNNMLTAITGYTDPARAGLCIGGPVRDYLDEVRKASDRAASLTRQLLAFSRRQVINPRVIDLNDVILDMDKMLRRLIRENIELVTLPTEDLRLVQADPGHIEQVLMNLAVNASDAMPEGGKLVVETLNVVVDDERAGQRADLASGDYVGLTVRDTGEGMTEEIRSRVFEPFFTTKEVGKGTGLGLSTVYGIIAQNGGAITVESEQGVGTTFRVLLPAVVDDKENLPLRDDAGFLPAGSETILLVEDEPLVRGAGAEVLRHQGYTVIEAANGVEALEAARNAGETIDLLVTDVVMPLMGGKELADRLKGSYPKIKVLYSTGYTEDTALTREVAAQDSSLMQKPFGPTELTERVRSSLDEP